MLGIDHDGANTPAASSPCAVANPRSEQFTGRRLVLPTSLSAAVLCQPHQGLINPMTARKTLKTPAAVKSSPMRCRGGHLADTWDGRIAALDWDKITTTLGQFGAAPTGPLLTPAECIGVRGLYGSASGFRSHIVMARHGFGRGEYKYFSYPLPDVVGGLRTALYPRLAPVANAWAAALNQDARYPDDHAGYLERCHAAGQTRPTPLLLQYSAGDYNCLHQDLYGAQVFPLQVAVLLSAPGEEFEGGEFVVVEQRPRMQSRAEVVTLRQGEGVVFAVHHRPVKGAKGTYRVNLRHGVSRIRSGARSTLGIIFHDGA
jgi:uncharacterized protein